MNTNKLALDALETDLLVEFERAMTQRDEYLTTGVSTAGHGGSHDTCIGHVLRAHFAALEAVQVEPVANSLGQPDKLEQIIDEYIDGYELYGEDEQGRDGSHTPNEDEKYLIKDAIIGLLAYPEWDEAWGEHLRTITTPQQAVPAWIAVSERMPDTGKKVLAYYKNDNGLGRRVRAEWVKAKTVESSCDGDIGEYDEATDTYYDPEGWYEKIDNWCDYTGVLIAHNVTHWMPLPNPPMEAA